MKDSDFKNLLRGAGELKSYLRGRLKPAREFELSDADLKAIRAHRGQGLSAAFIAAKTRAIRKRLRLSQSEFASLLLVSKATLQNWEQGRRKPDGPALALLMVADRAPAAVLHALHRKSA